MEHNKFYPKEKLSEMQGKRYIAIGQGGATRHRDRIIKALELCHSPLVSDCDDCPYKGKSVENGVYVGCTSVLMRDALPLIKELTGKCAILTELNERLRVVMDMSDTTLTDALRIVNEFCDKRIKRAKADTVRKMQTEIEARCIKGGIYPAFVKSTIDKIAEEIIEGETK